MRATSLPTRAACSRASAGRRRWPRGSPSGLCSSCASRRRSPRSAACSASQCSEKRSSRWRHKISLAMADKKPPAEIADLLQEDRSFQPPPEFRAKANVNDPGVYERADKDPEAFWASFASELEWFTPWTKILEWKPPHAKWFVGGTINASVNCVDRHVRGARRNKAALIWEGEPGDRRTLTYFDLH